MKYEKLDLLIYKRGIKRKAMAETLGITTKSLKQKIDGLRPFTWEQACMIQSVYFPDLSKDVIFEDATKKSA